MHLTACRSVDVQVTDRKNVPVPSELVCSIGPGLGALATAVFPMRVTTDRNGGCKLPIYPDLSFTVSWIMFGSESDYRQEKIGLPDMPPKLDLIVRRH